MFIIYLNGDILKLRYKIILFTVGIYLASVGLFFITIYSTVLNMGYTFNEFINYVARKPEIYLLFIGTVLAFIGMFAKKKD